MQHQLCLEGTTYLRVLFFKEAGKYLLMEFTYWFFFFRTFLKFFLFRGRILDIIVEKYCGVDAYGRQSINVG